MIEELTLAEYDAVLRQDFATFAARCFHEINQQANFAMSWHVELIASRLAAVRQGKLPRLIINLPPRHLKSLLASIAFPAWCLGHDASQQILCASKSAGSRRQVRPRLPQHHDEPVVSANFSDTIGHPAQRRAGIHYDTSGLPASQLDRRCIDRTRC
jgi:hypothetical protein